MDNPTDTPTKEEIEERLAWHKPRVEKIDVAIDTGAPKSGSGSDGGIYEFPIT